MFIIIWSINKMSSNIERLRELSAQIAADPDKVYELDSEDCIEVRKFMNPLGGVVSTKKSYVNLSLVNWREKYLRRFHMTSLVGYIYRMLEEYEPEKELLKEDLRYKAELKDATDPDTVTKIHEERVELIKSTVKGIVKGFLDRNFNYNPDCHLRGSHSSGEEYDPERPPRGEAIKAACSNAVHGGRVDETLKGNNDKLYKYLRQNLLAGYQAIASSVKTLQAAINTLGDLRSHGDNSSDTKSYDDHISILMKKYRELYRIMADMKQLADPLAHADTLNAWKVDPPADVYHQFDRYITNHYEQLNDVCAALYNEKSDFEYAVILYDAYNSAEEARAYRVQHESEFRTEVFTVESGAVTLLGPFKENRQRIDFFNKNTEILKKMMEQLETDHKLGEDLMAKQVKIQKRKNIEEAGPDHPALAEYTKTMNRAREFGAKKILSEEDKKELEAARNKAREIREDYEVPDGAIQVDMFFPDGDGLKKTKFYTRAEAPLHMEDGSEYVDKYQPADRKPPTRNKGKRKKHPRRTKKRNE